MGSQRSNLSLSRGSFLKGGLGVAAGAAAAGALPSLALGGVGSGPRSKALRKGDELQVPPVVRSRRELEARGVRFPQAALAPTALPITQNGTTFEMAQVATWLDSDQFAVGRWDGSMSVFHFQTAPFVGPTIDEAVNDPSTQGVQMITRLSGNALVTSNDGGSILLWTSASGSWDDLALRATCSFDPALGWATSGLFVSAGGGTLVVGHWNGWISIWRYDASLRQLTFLRSVDLRNSNPVNPWDLHAIYDLGTIVDGSQKAFVATGSDDGFVCIVQVPSGRVMSQTVFNPAAQRGINAISVRDDRLLVANCSVGPDDSNLWYFSIDRQHWTISLLDKANLKIDAARPQAFCFDTAFGAYSGGPCWFASTEEGALWMGTADSQLHLLGYQEVTSPLGAALAYNSGPGRLAFVAYDLYQFTTGAA
jgi:hypothetical protein